MQLNSLICAILNGVRSLNMEEVTLGVTISSLGRIKSNYFIIYFTPVILETWSITDLRRAIITSAHIRKLSSIRSLYPSKRSRLSLYGAINRSRISKRYSLACQYPKPEFGVRYLSMRNPTSSALHNALTRATIVQLSGSFISLTHFESVTIDMTFFRSVFASSNTPIKLL